MPLVFTVSNFQCADTAKSDHKAKASRRRGEAEVEMSGGRHRLQPCSPAAVRTEVTSCHEELDPWVTMVTTRVREQYRSQHLPVLWGWLWRINSFPQPGLTCQPTGSIQSHDFIATLLWTPCKSHLRAVLRAEPWTFLTEFPQNNIQPVFSWAVAEPPPSAYRNSLGWNNTN